MELDFVAPEGASGAPVLVEKDGTVAGMIVSWNAREVGGFRMPMGMAIDWQHLRDFGRTQGLGKQMFMTARLDSILAAASEKVAATAIQAASGVGIVRNARVVTVVPRWEESAVEAPDAEDYPHRITCSLHADVKVEGWGGAAPLGAGSSFLDIWVSVEVAIRANASVWNGELFGRLQITDIGCWPLPAK